MRPAHAGGPDGLDDCSARHGRRGGVGPRALAGVAAAKRLRAVLCKKSKETLEKVLEDAGKTALGSFVANLRNDIGAVQAALELPWTTSPAEGQINRLTHQSVM